MTDQPVENSETTTAATTTTTTTGGSGGAGGDIVARAGTYYRNTRYLMFALLVAMGGWFLYDGFVKYPAENKKIAELDVLTKSAQGRNDQAEVGRLAAEKKNYSTHSEWDLGLQRILGFSLPPLGLILLLRSLHSSRGEYRLSGTKLFVPGHPTIDLDEITAVNNDLWDKKGIAWIEYQTASGQSGEIKLDDFVYDRPPTDAIYDRIAEDFGVDDEDADDAKRADAGRADAGRADADASDGPTESREDDRPPGA